jgi:hypothetical protein
MGMSTPNPLIDIPATKYYFDNFVVASHHSVPHLIADLKKRRDMAMHRMTWSLDESTKAGYCKLIELIDEKLSTLNLDELNDLELAEPVYWVNELARRSAIEINTYGRIRPDTLSLLLCVSEEDFGTIMHIASGITNRLKLISDLAEASVAPVPTQMPRQE